MANQPRLCITTDIGGDPDDQQSLVRLLTYANEFRIEGLLATSSGIPGECADPSPRPDLIQQIIDGYAEVLPNLRKHAEGWPEAHHLHAVVKCGQAERGLSVIGEGHDTAASNHLIERVDAGSPADPLNLSIWGGQTDLAQALWRVKDERGPEGLTAFVQCLRVYDISDQDSVGNWIRAHAPGMYYILSKAPKGQDMREAAFRGMYLGGDESLTSFEWIEENIRSKGPLGVLYPTKTWTAPNPHGCLKEGDTPSWFFFLPTGGNNPADPSQPGWGGQFTRQEDGWFRDFPSVTGKDPRESVSRHRPDFQADFARRMSWCVAD